MQPEQRADAGEQPPVEPSTAQPTEPSPPQPVTNGFAFGWVAQTTAALILAVLLLWIAYLARYAILLVYISALLATGFSPIARTIHRHSRIPLLDRQLPRSVAILIVYLAGVAIIAGVSFIVFPPLVDQVQQLVRNLPGMAKQAQTFLISHGIESHRLSVEELLKEMPAGTEVFGTIVGKFWSVIGGVVGVVIIIVLSFYLLNESESLFNVIVPLFPRHDRDKVRSVASGITAKVGAWMGGQLILSGVIGATTALGLGLLGLPYFYVLAVIAALGEFIPYAGPVIAAVPGIAIGLTESWQKALLVALFYLAQQQLENNILVPKLMRHQVGLNAAGVIIAILVGTELLGILGAILAVPTAAILLVLFQELSPSKG